MGARTDVESIILEHVAELALVVDAACGVVYANRAASTFGLRAGEPCPESLRAHPAQSPLVRSDGTTVTIQWTWTRLPGNLDLAIGRDATAEQRARDELRASEERFALAARAARDLIYDWDIVRDRLIWGGNASEIFALTVADLGVTVGDWAARIHPDDLPEVDRLLADAIARGTTFEADYRFRRGDGAWAFVRDRGLVVQGPDGRAVRMVGSMEDVTERRRAEERLRASEERYRFLAETTSDIVYEYDLAADTFRYVSPRVEEWLGVSPRRFETERGLWMSLMDPDDRARLTAKFERDAAERRPRIRYEYHLRTASGEMRPVHDVAALTYDAAGQVVRIFGTVSDVSELRVLQAELERAQKVESVGRLAGGIAHDFNNLLTGILANLSGARARTTDELARASLGEAERAVDRAAELVRGLLAYSRRAPYRPAALDVLESVRAVVRLLRPTLGPAIRIDVACAPDVGAAWADAGQLEQALVNLALNARDAMPQGGLLRFAIDEVVLDEAKASARPEPLHPGRFVRIAVEDTGCGMTPDVVARAFEPFFTTKPVDKGSGLGLPVVEGIVRQHEGWIELESQPGKGSRFAIHLPRSGSVAAAPASMRAPEEPRGGRETVLVVDDERAIRNAARTTLEQFGYEVAVAADGHEALDLVGKRRFDLVLLDLTMPGMSGRETLERLRATAPAPAVIVSSGYVLEDDRTLAGVDGFLAKPYRPEDLARAVRAALDRRVPT